MALKVPPPPHPPPIRLIEKKELANYSIMEIIDSCSPSLMSSHTVEMFSLIISEDLFKTAQHCI